MRGVPGLANVVNTAAIARPELISEVADRFGAQVLVLSADVRRRRGEDGAVVDGFEVTTHGGRRGTGVDAVEWCARAADLGAGEILLNSMDADGTKDGFDLELVGLMRELSSVPVIASGGAGAVTDFAPALRAAARNPLAHPALAAPGRAGLSPEASVTKGRE